MAGPISASFTKDNAQMYQQGFLTMRIAVFEDFEICCWQLLLQIASSGTTLALLQMQLTNQHGAPCLYKFAPLRWSEWP